MLEEKGGYRYLVGGTTPHCYLELLCTKMYVLTLI